MTRDISTFLFIALLILNQNAWASEKLEEIIKNQAIDQVIEKLKAHTYEVDASGTTPLHFAVQYYHEKRRKILEYLLSSGADVNARTKTCQDAPIHYATNIEVVKLLVDSGARPTLRNCHNGTVLHFLIQEEKITVSDIRYLIESLGLEPFSRVRGDGFCRPIELTKNPEIIAYLNTLERDRTDLDIGAIYITTARVKLRAEPSIKSRVLMTLNKGKRITVAEISPTIDTIDGKRKAWVKIEADAGNIGYIFGGYLSPVNECTAFHEY